MPYLLFLKKRQNFNCRLLQIIGGALRVNLLSIINPDSTNNLLKEPNAVVPNTFLAPADSSKRLTMLVHITFSYAQFFCARESPVIVNGSSRLCGSEPSLVDGAH